MVPSAAVGKATLTPMVACPAAFVMISASMTRPLLGVSAKVANQIDVWFVNERSASD